jgi:hypothetical protein
MNEFTRRDRLVIAAAYEVEAEHCEKYKTWNPLAWYVSRAIALYLRERANAVRKEL